MIFDSIVSRTVICKDSIYGTTAKSHPYNGKGFIKIDYKYIELMKPQGKTEFEQYLFDWISLLNIESIL